MERILVYGMTNNPGGIESYLMNMMDLAAKQGIIFDFVTDFTQIAYEDKIRKNGSKIYYIPAKGKKIFKHWKAMFSILHRHPEYKIVYFNILDAGAVITMFAPWLLKRRIFTHSHNGLTDKQKLHKICRPFMNFVTEKYITCSKLAGEFMFGKGIMKRKDVLILPNAVDIDKYRFDLSTRNKIRKELKIENNFVICHIGRLSNQKNPFGLIDIFKAVTEIDSSAILLSIGTGELRNEFISYIQESGLSDKVKILGVRNDVPDILQGTDLFLLPSLYEGLPVVAIEAQAVGIPCVLSDRISKEVNISGTVSFMSLEKPTKQWAELICGNRGKLIEDNYKKMSDAGYNISYFSKAQKILCKWMNENK